MKRLLPALTWARAWSAFTTLLTVSGLALVGFGVWSIYPPAGFVAWGAALVLIGERL